jgi:hypothetical protein
VTSSDTTPAAARRRNQLTGLAGIGWFVLFAVGAIGLQSEPQHYDTPAAQTREYFAAHGGIYLVGDYLVGVGFVLLFLPFVALLRSIVHEHVGPATSQLILAGGISTVVVGGIATSFLDGVALARGAVADEVISALQYANATALSLLGLPAALFAAAAAVAILRSGALPRWLAPIGLVAAVLLVAGAAFVLEGTSDGVLWAVRFVSFIVFALFVLAISVCLLLGRGAE